MLGAGLAASALLWAVAEPAGRWLWPVPGPQVLAGFDPPAQRWQAGHRGVDLAAGTGTPVRAIGDGVVVFVGEVAGKPVVSIRHRSGPAAFRSTYEPVDSHLAEGDDVRAGDPIGTIAGTGGHCAGRCLHLGIRVPGGYADPLRLLLRAPVLKPSSTALG